ncbi:MAG: chromatin protein Cren7 [Desulfurococcales archaeon]|nr:chromatin protein Cren7 [Desulfurococcales archaeon]
MPKRKQDPFVCPVCGTRVGEPDKTWQLVSPLPDKRGRITVTVMGSFTCPNCGYKWRAVINKLKVGSGDLEIEGAKGARKLEPVEPPPDREGEVIEIDLDDL